VDRNFRDLGKMYFRGYKIREINGTADAYRN